MTTITIKQIDGTTRVIRPLYFDGNAIGLVEAVTKSNLRYGVKNWTSYEVS